MKKYFVTGIHTDIGKTVISAILTQKLQADYWKPVQAGLPKDSDQIKMLVSNELTIHPEGIFLTLPMSPHAAAALENRSICLNDLTLPKTKNSLIIEGAGGLLVPLNRHEMVIDIARKFDAEVILVSKNYLGSINHTLLSIKYLQYNNFKIAGIIFNGEPNEATENVILETTGIKYLGSIGIITELNPKQITLAGAKINLP